MEKGDYFSRHSIKPKGADLESSEFFGISGEGVELAREKARKIIGNLEASEGRTIMILGGVSEVPRTKSTAMVYGQEIKEYLLAQGRDDIIVILPEDLDQVEGYTNKVKFLIKKIGENPDKKFVLVFPLFMREFSLKDRWTDEEGNLLEYTKELLKRNGNNEEAAMKDWFDNQGRIGDLFGPNPKEVAEQQLAGLERLRNFARKYIPDRPLIIGSVGHSWNLDAVAVYLANNGEISREAFEKMGAKMIGETEMITILERDGRQILEYGDVVIPLEK